MPWALVVVRQAEKQLKRLRPKDQQRLLAVLEEMRYHPFGGDLVYLKGQANAFRRRVGSWRILFDVHPQKKIIVVIAIKRRTSSTY